MFVVPELFCLCFYLIAIRDRMKVSKGNFILSFYPILSFRTLVIFKPTIRIAYFYSKIVIFYYFLLGLWIGELFPSFLSFFFFRIVLTGREGKQATYRDKKMSHRYNQIRCFMHILVPIPCPKVILRKFFYRQEVVLIKVKNIILLDIMRQTYEFFLKTPKKNVFF